MVRPPGVAPNPPEDVHLEAWLRSLAAHGAPWASFLGVDPSAQQARGYFHTLREIAQQPLLWSETAQLVVRSAARLREFLERSGIRPGGEGTILLTGSGSSLYAGACVAPGLQEAFGLTVRAVSPDVLLTQPRACLPGKGPALLVSLGRSGNSPESCAAVDLLLESRPQCGHLVITCNAAGRLATRYRDDPRVLALVLDDRTNDRSLVMTSSFTNLVVAAAGLGHLGDPRPHAQTVGRLAAVGAGLLQTSAAPLRQLALSPFRSAVFLGGGSRKGAALEAGLKLLEMSRGEVPTLAEGFLGLRHGPMAAVHGDSLVVCFLSTEDKARAYECDLIRELSRKGLGAAKLLMGTSVPRDLAASGDTVVTWEGPPGSDGIPVLEVLAGQMLAFFRCLAAGGKPDSPSPAGVISRVVEEFRIHSSGGQ